MTRDPRLRDGLHPADGRFLSQIETHGWNVTTVFKSEGESGPEWAYSTGLFYSYQHPEIAIFGLDLDNMHEIVNNIGDEVKKGNKFKAGAEYMEIFERIGCRFREVHLRHYEAYFGWAIWFYEEDAFPVLQCFWPDKHGKYPWEDGCSDFVRTAQPLLFE
ncbi:MAG: DUF4262 domain-containing protein [Terriglobales bacterium]|jgi:hypothetical protein